MDSHPRRRDRDRPTHRRKAPRRASNPLIASLVVAGLLLLIGGVAWAAVHFYQSRRGEPRLLGTWQSDADTTIAELRKTRDIPDDREQKLRQVFGKMKVTYTAKTVTVDFDGDVDTQPYQVVEKGIDIVVLKHWSKESKKDEQFRIRFDDADTYWIDVPIFGIRECFRRVK
ncbi:MAG: hypothetical protein U0746_16990 [Gemmataceae bacterium]